MAYREVTMFEIKEVLRLWLAGTAKKKIGRQLRMDVKSVRRYIATATSCGLGPGSTLDDEVIATVLAALPPAPGRPQGDGWALCAAHAEFIRGHLKGRVRLSKIRKLLGRQGVEVSYATLRRFAISELSFGRTAATIPVADCGPGEEVQVDTGWMICLEPDLFGKCRRFRAWIFTAVLSRDRFVYPCFQETTMTAIESCEAAWEHFGGIFKVIIVDNTKTIVTTADPLEPLLNRAFLEYAQARGFHIDTTRVRSPKDKARVERAVQTVRDDCFAGERLSTIEEAQDRARFWCLHEYGMRRHTRTYRMPREHFEAVEKPALLPPPTSAYDVPHWCEPKVHRDQHAQVAKALYSLPTCFVGKTLVARADRTTVRFYDGTALVKTHPRTLPGKPSTDRNDFPSEKTAYAMRDIDYLAQKAAEHGDAVGRFAKALLAGPLPWTRMRRVYALLGLVKRYGASRVEETCARALAAEMLDVTRLARMLKIVTPPPEPPRTNVIPIARYLRPTSQYAMPFASREEERKTGDDT